MSDKWNKSDWLRWQKAVIKEEWSKGGAANVKTSSDASRKNKG